MIKIQLIGTNEGYLDVLENSIIALNISLADIKDVTKRTGSFSKTIVLPGTKNNNTLLNDYFEVNVIDGSFSINKIQKCLILDDNVPLFNNTVLQLINVKKRQATNMEDDIVEYEISIKDTTADFFTIINNRYLNQLDFSDFSHTYSAAEIADSFSHSWVDGYKYVIPFGDDNFYPITELKPAIYAKQYWNRIHADAGFSYTWINEFGLNVRFDKLLIPFSSGEIKLNENSINASRVIATGPDQNLIFPSGSLISGGFYLWYGSLFPATIDSEIQDPINAFNPATSLYTAPFDVTQPSCYEFLIEFDYEIVINNLQAFSGGVFNSQNSLYGQFNIEASVYNQRTTAFDSVYVNASPTPTIVGSTFSPGSTSIYIGRAKAKINTSNHQIGDNLEIFLGVRHAAQSPLLFQRISEVILDVSNLDVTIQINSTQQYNTLVNLNQYVPLQIKQSDFVKSIMTMFNLFVEVDTIDPNKLIYTSRDEFYDNGDLVDWTDKLAREDEQEIRFLPELSAKSYIFSYKEDSDPANQGYKEIINEIYGQHQVIFSNNYVKGIERKEIIFSPTPMQESNWNSILPLVPSGNQKYNIRILLDNGNQPCQKWFLINYIDPNISFFPPSVTLGSWLELDYYPFVSHLDSEINPTFDLNFGVCDFYFYDIRNITNNNLFNNFWRRTCAQINNGKLMTAYFHLKGVDIANLRLNAKIRIDNSYWNINKIIDFDANKQELTKVELISIDDELPLPSFGADSEFLNPGQQLVTQFDPVFLSNNDIISKSVTQKYNDLNHINRTTNNSNNGVISLGSFNSINGGVKGVIIGDFISASQSGIYVGNNTFIGENLGNLGGLPSTLLVDNTTAGTDIIVDGGSKIVSGATDILELNSVNEIYSEVDDSTDVYSVQLTNPYLNISVRDSASSVYNNNIFLNNSSVNGILMESINQVTTDFSQISTTEAYSSMGHVHSTGDSSYCEVGYASTTPYAQLGISNGTTLDINSINIDNNGIDILANTSLTGVFGRGFISNTSISLEMTDSSTYQNSVKLFDIANAGLGVAGVFISSDNNLDQSGLLSVQEGDVTIKVENTTTSDFSEIVMSNQRIQINTNLITIGFLPDFADDAAAAAGGLFQGDIYQTDGTGAAPLNVAGIVMIKQ
jgi:hypothetical protein